MSQKFLVCVCLLVLLTLDCLVCVGSDGDCASVGVTQDFNSWSCPNSWGSYVFAGARHKTLVGKPEHMAAKALAFPGRGKGVPIPSSTAADAHCGDEVRNVGLLSVRSSWCWR